MCSPLVNGAWPCFPFAVCATPLLAASAGAPVFEYAVARTVLPHLPSMSSNSHSVPDPDTDPDLDSEPDPDHDYHDYRDEQFAHDAAN